MESQENAFQQAVSSSINLSSMPNVLMIHPVSYGGVLPYNHGLMHPKMPTLLSKTHSKIENPVLFPMAPENPLASDYFVNASTAKHVTLLPKVLGSTGENLFPHWNLYSVPLSSSTNINRMQLHDNNLKSNDSNAGTSTKVNPMKTTKTKAKQRPRLRNFLCTFPGCGKAFPDNAHLRDHIFVHTKEKNLKCDECSRSFSRISSLRSHASVHSNEKPFECEIKGCIKKYSSRSALRLHQHVHITGKDMACYYCQKSFSTVDDYENHMVSYHQSKVKPNFKCNKCQNKFSTKIELIIHLQSQHGIACPKLCPRTCCQRIEIKLNEQKELIQDLRYQIQRLEESQFPPEKVKKLQKAREKRSDKSKAITAPIELLQGPKPFECMWPSCKKRFTNYFQLKFHGRQHRNVNPLQIIGDQIPIPIGPKFCPVPGCPYSEQFRNPMKSLQIVKRHWQRMHQDSRPFICEDCPQKERKSFKTRDNLRSHRKECLRRKNIQ